MDDKIIYFIWESLTYEEQGIKNFLLVNTIKLYFQIFMVKKLNLADIRI